MIKNSILLCTYNEARYIENTVLNLDKSISDLEIIIVNDDSKDNTLSIIQKLKTNCELKVINRTKSKGLGTAFQRALIESRGKNIGWIDTNMGELADLFLSLIHI